MSASDMPKDSLIQDSSANAVDESGGVLDDAGDQSTLAAEQHGNDAALADTTESDGLADDAVTEDTDGTEEAEELTETAQEAVTEDVVNEGAGTEEDSSFSQAAENACAGTYPNAEPDDFDQPPPLDADMLRHGPRAIIYIFSGPHLGAEIALPLGTFLIGSDASCDIILSGTSLAPRHASLRVVMTSGNIRVDIKPLDGGVSLEGAGAGQSGDECQPPAGEPWYLGLTCMVWNRPGVAQPMPQIVVGTTVVPDESRNGSDANSVGGGAAPTTNVGSDGPDGAAAQVLKLDLNSQSSSAQDFQASLDGVAKKSKNVSRLASVFVLFALLAVLSVVVGPKSISPDKYPEIIEEKIKEAGLAPLEVVPFGYGVEVRGEVKSDAERTKLYSLAQNMQFPVYLDRITVQNDKIHAVRTAFTARGFLPSVVIKDIAAPAADFRVGSGAVAALMGSKAPLNEQEKTEGRASAESSANAQDGESKEVVAGGATPALAATTSSPALAGKGGSGAQKDGSQQKTAQIMVVSAYIADRLLEDSVFAAVAEDVPNLPPIRRHIVHQDELEQVLQPALDKAGLGFAKVRYLPNKVEVAGQFDQEALLRARMVLEETGKRLGIPLPALIQVTVVQKDIPAVTRQTSVMPELASLMPSPSDEEGDAPQDNRGSGLAEVSNSDKGSLLRSSKLGDVLGGLRVTGVTMTPMRFVTTADGQRLFEGSELPSGYTLETISTSTLTLSKGGQMVTYPLRGAS